MSSLRLTLYSLPITLYLIYQFTTWSAIKPLIGIFAFIAFLLSSFSAKGTYRISGAVFFVLGLYYFVTLKLPWSSFFLSFESMLGLLSIFFVLPFLSSVIRVGHYDRNLSYLLQDQVASTGQLYRRGSFVTHLLAPLLSIATFPLLVQSLRVSLRHLPDQAQTRFYVKSVLRSFALCLNWNPMEIMVITVLGITGVNFIHLFPVLFILAVTALLIDGLMAKRSYRDLNLSVSETPISINRRSIYRKVIQLMGILIGLVGIVVGIQELFHQGFLLSVVLIAIPFSFVWASAIRKFKRYLFVTLPFWRERISGLSNYIFMFIGAGFFIHMITESGVLKKLEPWLQLTTEKPYMLYGVIAVFFVVGAIIGFHPLVSLTLLEPILKPILPFVNPVPLSMVLITCSLATSMYSPYNLSVLVMSDLVGTNAYRVGSWNFLFAMAYVLSSILVALILGLI